MVDDTILLLPPGLDMELDVWGLQDTEEASIEPELTGVPAVGVILGCWKPNGFNLGLFVDRSTPILLERTPTHWEHFPRAGSAPMLAESKICLPGSVHIESHRLSDSLGKLFGVHFLLMTMKRVVKVWVNKWLVLAETKCWLLWLLCVVVVFAVSGWASSRAADIDDVHQNVTSCQT